ncbi:MAG: FAD:protein FMN transferase [Deltaproteobacteria bacterium]|nr:FAD:protein FMN transferase [Deltaproteobacteria bacterium]
MTYATGLVLGFFGTTFWFVSAETYVVAKSPSLSWPMLLVVCAACGQVAGFTALYFLGEKILRRLKRLRAKVETFDVSRFQKSTYGVLAASSVLGFPPLSVVAVASGTIRLKYSTFFPFALVGRIIRFTIVLLLGQQFLALTCAGEGIKRKGAETPREEASFLGPLRLSALALKSPWDAGAAREVVRRSRVQMGTTVSFSAVGDETHVARAFDEAFTEIERFEAMASEYRPDSVISTLNENAGRRPVDIPDDLFALIERCLALSRESGGAFDVTFLGMGKIWDFRADPPRVPDAKLVETERKRIDHRRLRLDAVKKTAFLERAGMRVGLGAIGKGQAIDRAATIFRRHGLANFLAAASGDLYVAGSKPGGAPWQIGIQHPRDPTRLVARLTVRDRGVSTSGDYERFFVAQGRRFHHIIDPRTGYPADGLASVTVIAPDATTSDSLSTAAFVLGPARALDFLAKHPGVDALLIDTRGRITLTPGFRALVRFEPPATESHAGGDFYRP